MGTEELHKLLDFITSEYNENEWIEYKHNFHSKEEIGERISALSNSACLNNEPYAYLIYGVEDGSKKITGTDFHALSQKVGNEELEIWLRMHIDPKIDYETIREITGAKGYAVGLEGLVEWINGQLPANEQIGTILREDKRMYPEIAIRELVANMIVHQDFTIAGCPTVEIYSDRIEFSNPGIPIIQSDRFIDEYAPRNDILGDIMRRLGFCEEKGSGMDKVIFYNELYQLPAIKISVQENRTCVGMYAYKTWAATSNTERIRACYQHSCLKYVSNEQMTNQSLRERFQIEEQNAAMVSRVIKATLDKHMIKEFDPESRSRKNKRYIPYWA